MLAKPSGASQKNSVTHLVAISDRLFWQLASPCLPCFSHLVLVGLHIAPCARKASFAPQQPAFTLLQGFSTIFTQSILKSMPVQILTRWSAVVLSSATTFDPTRGICLLGR